MGFVVGASSLHHALEKLAASLHNQLFGTYLAILSLSFNPNAVSLRKTVQHYFESFLYQLNRHFYTIILYGHLCGHFIPSFYTVIFIPSSL